ASERAGDNPRSMTPLPRIAHHFASYARFRRHRDERERSDAQAMRELAAAPPQLARGLELEWLGVAGYRLSFEGETLYIDPFLSPAAYRCGQVWGIHIDVGGVSFYHRGSSNLVDDAICHRGVDVFLAGIAGRSFTSDYWQRILTRLEPRTVVASHFDDFFRPLEGPMGFSLNVNLSAFPEEVAAVSGDFAVAALEPMRAVSG